MASYKEWLESVPIKKTPTGVRFDLTIYVYPDGHGNVISGGNQPANSLREAEGIFRDLWEMSQKKAARTDGE